MSQNGATVLRNVFQFATILNQASSTDVQKWDDVSLLNALDWAAYCKELSEGLREKGLETELNSHLAQMSMLLQPVSCLYLTLTDLQQAKSLLVKTLMCNTHVSKHLREKLEKVLMDQQDGREILAQINLQLSALNTARDLHTSLSALIHGVAYRKGNNPEFQANFLVNHLIDVVSQAKKKDRFESYCHAVCTKLVTGPEGNTIFVCMFKRTKEDIEPDRERWLQVVLDHLVSWLKVRILQDWSNCPLLQADVSDAVDVAVAHSRMFSLYLDVLTMWGDSCEPRILAGGALGWSSPDGGDSHALTRHFLCLLSSASHQDRKQEVVSLITNRVQQEQFTVWRHVAREALQLLKQG